MTKAAPHTPTVSVGSKENADALIVEATRLRLNLSPSQAHGLIHAADGYAQALERDQALPRVGETREELERIATQADQLLTTLRSSANRLAAKLKFARSVLFPRTTIRLSVT